MANQALNLDVEAKGSPATRVKNIVLVQVHLQTDQAGRR